MSSESRNGEENTGPANQTPKCAEIQRYLAGKYPPGVEYDKLAYYMEAAECYGQLAREMELEASGTLTRSETAGWIPVEKALPDNGDPVLVFQGSASHMRRTAYYDTLAGTGWHWCGFHEGDRCDPDAWMKIPPYERN